MGVHWLPHTDAVADLPDRFGPFIQ